MHSMQAYAICSADGWAKGVWNYHTGEAAWIEKDFYQPMRTGSNTEEDDGTVAAHDNGKELVSPTLDLKCSTNTGADNSTDGDEGGAVKIFGKLNFGNRLTRLKRKEFLDDPENGMPDGISSPSVFTGHWLSRFNGGEISSLSLVVASTTSKANDHHPDTFIPEEVPGDQGSSASPRSRSKKLIGGLRPLTPWRFSTARAEYPKSGVYELTRTPKKMHGRSIPATTAHNNRPGAVYVNSPVSSSTVLLELFFEDWGKFGRNAHITDWTQCGRGPSLGFVSCPSSPTGRGEGGDSSITRLHLMPNGDYGHFVGQFDDESFCTATGTTVGGPEPATICDVTLKLIREFATLDDIIRLQGEEQAGYHRHGGRPPASNKYLDEHQDKDDGKLEIRELRPVEQQESSTNDTVHCDEEESLGY